MRCERFFYEHKTRTSALGPDDFSNDRYMRVANLAPARFPHTDLLETPLALRRDERLLGPRGELEPRRLGVDDVLVFDPRNV